MRWFKKIMRAILNLLPLFAIFFIVNGNVSATSHELEGIRFATPIVPSNIEEYENAGVFYQNTNSSANQFYISFSDDREYLRRWPSPSIGARDSANWFRFYSYWDGQKCVYDSFPSGFNVDYYNNIPIGWRDDDDNSLRSFSAGFLYTPEEYIDNDSLVCSQLGVPFSGSFPFDQDSIDYDFPFTWTGQTINMSSWYWDNQNPYWYSADGFWTDERHIDLSTGQQYKSSFYLSNMLGGSVNKFKWLSIPIYDSFTDSDCTGEFESGDTFTFEGVFRFDEPNFTWNPDLDSTSKFGLNFEGGNLGGNLWADCTTNLFTVNGYQQLEFSCPYTFTSTPDWFSVGLHIYSGETATYVWDSSDFVFGGMKIITHDDDSYSGCKLHSDLTGKHIGGDYTDEESNQGGTFSDLIHLFNFTFINPFAPLFNLFIDGSSCASIPTIASMIHSEETTVCPFFDSTTRSVLTPVFGLASVMLVFGFTVRWLKSSSGNDFLDTGGKK